MTAQTNLDSQQINESLAQFIAAVAASERRHASTAKLVRWAAIAVIAIAVMIGLVGFNVMNVAQAVTTGDPSGDPIECNPLDPASMQTMKCALGQVSTLFLTMNQLMVGMRQTPQITQWLENHPEVVQGARQAIFQQNPRLEKRWNECRKQQRMQAEWPEGIPCPQINAIVDGAARQMAFGGLVAQTFVDAGTLVNRIRDDSNELRLRTGHVGGPIGAVSLELRKLNVALASVPVLVHQMGIMTHSMGSTMGRVGNMLPW